MSADAPCPLCVKKFNPDITMTELMAIGASVSEMCPQHVATVSRSHDREVVDIDFAKISSAVASATISFDRFGEAMKAYNEKIISINTDELRRSIKLIRDIR